MLSVDRRTGDSGETQYPVEAIMAPRDFFIQKDSFDHLDGKLFVDCSSYESKHVDDEDIWGTRYTYTVDRWEAISPLTKEGWGQEPDFPTFTTAENCLSNQPVHGCVRASNEPRLTFTIHFFYYKSGNEERQDLTQSMARNIWDGFYLGENYPAILNGFGEIRAIQGIDPEYEELMDDN